MSSRSPKLQPQTPEAQQQAMQNLEQACEQYAQAHGLFGVGGGNWSWLIPIVTKLIQDLISGFGSQAPKQTP